VAIASRGFRAGELCLNTSKALRPRSAIANSAKRDAPPGRPENELCVVCELANGLCPSDTAEPVCDT
jgi:hypothetical protein